MPTEPIDSERPPYGPQRHRRKPDQGRDPRQTQFYVHIAHQNREVLGSLMRNDERLRNSDSTSKLYPRTQVLSPPTTTDFALHNATVEVVPMDSFDTAQSLYAEGVQDIAVLNMASSDTPGGWYLSGAGAQEEALCRRSSLYVSLSACAADGLYPIPRHGAIYSPDVLVIRKSDDEKCQLLTEMQVWWTSVISVAALFRPRLIEDGTDFLKGEDRRDSSERVKALLRVAVIEGRRNLVLSALGCGAFRNPPHAVAQLFKEVLQDAEFRGRFQGVWFSILDRRGSTNYDIYHKILQGLVI